jgi:CxxC motif-containing protein (DUF1111 family)/predicted lipoprotein with Yx(FWY)xxD motif
MVNRYIRSLAVSVAIILSFSVLAADATRIQLIAHIPIAPPAEPSLLSATATSSALQSGAVSGAGSAALAVDGSLSSRWESQHGLDPSWLKLDLGANYTLSEVIIKWEAANAASYRIDGSLDGNNWTNSIATFSGGTWNPGAGVRRTDTLALSGSYRYVRMYGISRPVGNYYGYSIWEMEVYGIPAAPPADTDGDGVDDAIDQCPNTAAGANVDASGCALVDTDNDGVIDSVDSCPNTPAGSNVNVNGCAISDADNDGVLDGLDQCANTPSGDVVGPDGCTVVLDGIEVSTANGLLVGGPASSKPGFVLYVFDNDLSSPGSSNCNGGCATSWPPLMVEDDLASGVNNLSSINRTGGKQVTYNGRPLYYYIGDTNAGDDNGDGAGGVWHTVALSGVEAIESLYNSSTALEQATSYVRADGVVVTRFGDRGRDRHAKDIGYYDPNNIYNSDHYDHWLAHYWEYRTARVQFEDHVPNGQSLIRATYITESRLGVKEFRVWFNGTTTTGQFHYNPAGVEIESGTFNNNFERISSSGNQYKYTVDITERWKNVATFNEPLAVGMNMEFEISQFLINPPAGARKNYYGTGFLYVVGTPGLAPFEWQRNVTDQLGTNDGTPIPAAGLLGGDTTLGYNYSEEPAGRFIQMATNLSHVNAQPFVRGRRVHHTSFVTGIHDERNDNPVWSQQAGKAGNHYVNESCAKCHVRNGRALVADVGGSLDKWVFKVGDADGNPDPLIGSVLQTSQISGAGEGTVTLAPWTELPNGLRSPNYVFSNGTPARFSARIAPQLVGLGLLEAVEESTILALADPDDANNDGISGRAALVTDPVSGALRLGRFGYKAATFSVEHQSASAFNTDIGVMTSLFPTPDCGSAQTTCGSSGAELSDSDLSDLVKYVSLLGVGARRDYANTTGETLFDNAGCASCHQATLTTSDFHPLTELRSQTIHPYTDLLLHDMGPGLADNLGEGIATGAEWRTAPLWGLGLSRNVQLGDAKANDSVSLARDPVNDPNRVGYLHDGRARTIDEAIRWHGGEAESSKQAYEALSQSQRDAVLAFLNSL